MSIAEQVARVQADIRRAAEAAGRNPEEILLVAATKTQSPETVRSAITAGIRACGENRVQELVAKQQEDAYAGAAVHFIGHLQRNKLNKVVGRVDLIESVDSRELLERIERQAAFLGIVQDILLEINVGEEKSKSGIPPAALPGLSDLARSLPHVRLRGLMAIPPIANAPGANRQFFRQMYQLYVDIKEKSFHNSDIQFLSMGMSRDYADAIAAGANLVRIGTALFGPRTGGTTDQ